MNISYALLASYFSIILQHKGRQCTCNILSALSLLLNRMTVYFRTVRFVSDTWRVPSNAVEIIIRTLWVPIIEILSETRTWFLYWKNVSSPEKPSVAEMTLNRQNLKIRAIIHGAILMHRSSLLTL